jgi:benzoate transport
MAPASSTGDGGTVAATLLEGKFSAHQLLVVFLCMFFNLLDGFDITAMAVVAGSVAGELSLSPDRLGWVFSAALGGMMAGAMILAPVSDIVGRRRVIILSLSLVGVSVLLTAGASSLPEFIILRFLAGVGAGAMLACQATLAAEYSPEKYRALSVAVVVAGYPLGALLTAVFAGLIMPEYGWRGMFWFGGAGTLAMGIVAWLLIPESIQFLLEKRPADALQRINRILHRLHRRPLNDLPMARTDSEPDPGFSATIRALTSPSYRGVTFRLWAAFFLSFASLYFLMSWIPKLMEDSGFDVATGRNAFLLFNLGGVLGIFILGWLSTRFKLTNIVFGSLMASAVGMVLFAALPGKPALLMPVIFAVGLLMQGGFTGLYGAAAKAYSTGVRSTGIGWAVGLGRSGAVVGPALAGYLIAAGLDMSANFVFFALPMAISALIAWRLNIR